MMERAGMLMEIGVHREGGKDDPTNLLPNPGAWGELGGSGEGGGHAVECVWGGDRSVSVPTEGGGIT